MSAKDEGYICASEWSLARRDQAAELVEHTSPKQRPHVWATRCQQRAARQTHGQDENSCEGFPEIDSPWPDRRLRRALSKVDGPDVLVLRWRMLRKIHQETILAPLREPFWHTIHSFLKRSAQVPPEPAPYTSHNRRNKQPSSRACLGTDSPQSHQLSDGAIRVPF